MSQYTTRGPEDLVQCPYDRVHMVRAKRFPYHLMKCRKNYAGREYQTCPFNARHEMPKPELRYHMANCPDQAMVQQDILFNQQSNEEGVYFKGCTDVPAYNTWQAPESSEDWDAEVADSAPRIGFDPRILENPENPKFRDTVGMTPAEKKLFKERLWKRHQMKEQGIPFNEQEEEERERVRLEELLQQRQQSQQQPPTTLRLPKQVPLVLQAAQIQSAGGTQQTNKQVAPPSKKSDKPSVFAYSLAAAGIGRGRPQKKTETAPPVGKPLTNGISGPHKAPPQKTSQPMVNGHSDSMRGVLATKDNAAASLEALYRGRGVGRGKPQDTTRRPGGVPGLTQPRAPPGDSGASRGRGLMPASVPSEPKVFSVAGRGRGVAQEIPTPSPQFIVPNVTSKQQKRKKSSDSSSSKVVNGLNKFSVLEPGEAAGQEEDSDDECETPSFSSSSEHPPAQHDPQAEKIKEMRKVNKKIRQIEVLEEQRASGSELSEDQVKKVSQKKRLEKQLAALRL